MKLTHTQNYKLYESDPNNLMTPQIKLHIERLIEDYVKYSDCKDEDISSNKLLEANTVFFFF